VVVGLISPNDIQDNKGGRWVAFFLIGVSAPVLA
jgi:hypothetical protein